MSSPLTPSDIKAMMEIATGPVAEPVIQVINDILTASLISDINIVTITAEQLHHYLAEMARVKTSMTPNQFFRLVCRSVSNLYKDHGWKVTIHGDKCMVFEPNEVAEVKAPYAKVTVFPGNFRV